MNDMIRLKSGSVKNGMTKCKMPALPNAPEVSTVIEATNGSWKIYKVQTQEASSQNPTITASTMLPPPMTYAERISSALSKMRDIAREKMGPNLIGSPMKRIAFIDDDGVASDMIVLCLNTFNATQQIRAEVAESLLDFLADNNDPDVRSDMSVEVS